MEISAALVKKLREQTNAGMMDCKKALMASSGDFDKALEYLREKGIASAQQKASRIAEDGAIGSYIHADGKIGVLIEVNCETDFVARTDSFRQLVRDLAMQVAGLQPRWVSVQDIPASQLEEVKSALLAKFATEGSASKSQEAFLEEGLSEFYLSHCLLTQSFVRDGTRTVEQLIQEHVLSLGEKIMVRRFVCYRLAEDL
jgi:elongation factor Ts